MEKFHRDCGKIFQRESKQLSEPLLSGVVGTMSDRTDSLAAGADHFPI